MALSACALAACGSTAKYVSAPRQPLPVNLTVYIAGTSVSVSPSSVGAGPVELYITNQASRAESLQIGRPGGPVLGGTGPINPQGATQVGVTLSTPGQYIVNASSGGTATASAPLTVGPPRAASSSTLLTP